MLISKSKKTVKFKLALFAILISRLSYLYINNHFYKYDTELIGETNHTEKGIDARFFYEDFNNNGISEHFTLNNDNNENSVALCFYNEHDRIDNQINIWKSSLLNKSTYVGDYNQDGIKELFFMITRNDSLFLNIMDYFNQSFIVKDRLVFVRKNIRKEFPWGLSFRGNLVDVNNDGYLELLIGINAYYSLSPRGFLLYDITNDKLLDSFFSKAVFLETAVVDLDNDGSDEILTTSTSYDNFVDTTGINDKAGWFVVFNNQLKDFLPPKRYGKVGTQVRFSVTKNKEILLSANAVNSSIDCRLIKFNAEGKVILEKKIYSKDIGVFYHIEIAGNSYIIDVFDDGCIKLYNENFEVVNKLKTDVPTQSFLFAHDLNNDGLQELFFINKKDILITNSKLEIVSKIQLLSTEFNIQPILTGKEFSNLSITNNKTKQTYQFKSSRVHSYAPLMSLLIGILSFFILLFINNIIEWFLIFIKSYSYFINDSSSSLLLISNQGKIITCNKQLENEIIGKKISRRESFSKYFDSDNEITVGINEAIKNESNLKRKIVFTNNANTLLNGELEITRFKSFWGYTAVYLVKIVDQTEEIINERIQAWSHTARKLAHEIKTPLGSILLNMKAIKRRISKSEFSDIVEIDDDIKTITEQIDRIKNLTSSFLKISNIESANIVAYSPVQLIDLALQKFSGYISYGVEIKVKNNFEGAQIYFDKKQFIEVTQIIIENAIDAMKGTGTIFITINSVDSNLSEIIYRDTGSGIEKKILKSIFEPYFTTKKEGTGLGLAFAKKIVEDNKGKISIDSEINKGTRVIIQIPSSC